MSSTKSFKKTIAKFFLPDNPKDFKTEYNHPEVDRQRREPKTSKYDKFNFLNAFNWYPSHYSKFERTFLVKFDICVLFFLCASFYTKYLDNSNVGSAYVSGLKADLNLHGNELNYFNTCYTVGYALFQIPITLLITKRQFSRHLLIFCELAWGLMTLANAYVTNAQEMYVIRFFVGVFEACSFPATYVILSSYLTEEELFKRAGVYGAFATAGSASAGALQTQARRSLDGVFGLAGWRWQFIIDSVLTFGIFLYGFFLFPGIPSACKEFGVFSEDEMIFARKRLENKIAFPDKFTKKTLIETLKTWQIYFASFLWVLHHLSWYSNGPKLYMKARTDIYTTSMVTTWDSYIYCVGIPCSIIVPPLCQYYGKLIPVNLVMLTAYYACIILVTWNVPNAVMISAFFMQEPFRSGLAQNFYSWIASLCKDNVEKKTIVLSWVQALSYGINAFAVTLQYDLSGAPRFKKGYIVNFVIIAATHVVFFIGLFLDKYDRKYIPQFAGNRHTDGDEKLLSTVDVAGDSDSDSDVDSDASRVAPGRLGHLEYLNTEKKQSDGDDAIHVVTYDGSLHSGSASSSLV